MTSLSLRRGIVWTMGGTLSLALSQWLLIVVLARMAGPEVVGQFSLITATATSIFILLGLNLRLVLATDVRRRWRLADYERTQKVLAGLALTVTTAVGYALGMRGEVLLSLVMVGLARGTELYCYTLAGYFQLKTRMDLVSVSMMLRAALGIGGFTLGYALSQELVVACAGMLVGWQLTLWLWDIPRSKHLVSTDLAESRDVTGVSGKWSTTRTMTITALPLGLDAGLRALTLSAPRFGISFYLGDANLGVYTALSNFALLPTLVTGALAAATVPALAQYYVGRKRMPFVRLYVRVLCIAALLCASYVVVAQFAGTWIVRIVLGEEFVDHELLIVLVLAYSVAVLQGKISLALQAANKFLVIALADAVGLGSTVALCTFLVPKYGSIGAAAALGLGMALSSAVLAVSAGLLIRQMRSFDNSLEQVEQEV